MPNINDVNKNIIPDKLNHVRRAGRADKADKKANPPLTKEAAITQTNKLLLELNISIKIEARFRLESQAAIEEFLDGTEIDISEFTVNGKSVLDLTQDEAMELVSADGFYGVEQTAQRIIDFAVNGAGDDVERLQVAREAVIKGFKEAEAIFGGSLPEISYDTLEKVLEVLDGQIRDMGGTVMNVEA